MSKAKAKFWLGFGVTFVFSFGANLFVLFAVEVATALSIALLVAVCAGLSFLVGQITRDGLSGLGGD